MIAVIHRLPLGAAYTHHWALVIFSMASPPNALRSSSIFPLRGYESKYVGTHNIKTKQTTAAHFSSAFYGTLEGCIGLIHSWVNEWFSTNKLLLPPSGGLFPKMEAGVCMIVQLNWCPCNNFLVKLWHHGRRSSRWLMERKNKRE